MNPEEALAFWNNQNKGMFKRAKTNTIPSRRRVKSGKSVTRRMRKASSQSMLDMGQTKRHIPLPRFPDERTKVLFAAYEKRKK